MQSPGDHRIGPVAWLAALVGAGCIFAAASCSNLPTPTSVTQLAQKLPFVSHKPVAAEPPRQVGPTKVMADGTALALNDPQSELEHRQRFVERFQQLLQEDRDGAAQLLVERHPDLALEVLRESPPVSSDWLFRLAEFHDAHCFAPESVSWSGLLTRRAAQPEPLAQYSTVRESLMTRLRNGQFEDASITELQQSADKTGELLWRIDAAYLTGLVHLMADRPQLAVTSLEQAAQLARPVAPYQAAHAALLLSESRRRAGDIEGANVSWQAGVELAADLLILPRPIADPVMWDRALYLQPVGIAWPPVVKERVRQMVERGPSAARGVAIQRLVTCCTEPQPDLALLSTCIAGWRLERGEADAALVAFKRAETVATAEADAWLRVAEASALAQLEQSGAASTVLAQLASQEPATAASRAAMADLGSIRIHEGALQQGTHLLRKALESEPNFDWPGRASAEADLALALIMVGEESAGLDWLARAQRRFEADGDHELLAKSLWNEARYYEHKKDRAKAKVAQQRVDAMRL